MVDKFWKSCWIFTKLVCQGFCNQRLQKNLSNKFYQNPRTFPKLVCPIRSVILNFWNLTSALLSETPKIHRCQVSLKSNNSLKTRPPRRKSWTYVGSYERHGTAPVVNEEQCQYWSLVPRRALARYWYSTAPVWSPCVLFFLIVLHKLE